MPEKCPRCGGGIPSDEREGEYPGALSRVDNETEICSKCGRAEGMWQFFGGGKVPLPPLNQPINL